MNRRARVAKSLSLAIASCLLLSLAACSKSDAPTTADTAAPAPVAAPAATATEPAAEPAPAPAVATATAITGIAECDNFLAAYEQCVMEKAPAEVRTQLASGIEQWKTAWQTMAANDATKASLPQVCQQTRDASVPGLQAYGCTL